MVIFGVICAGVGFLLALLLFIEFEANQMFLSMLLLIAGVGFILLDVTSPVETYKEMEYISTQVDGLSDISFDKPVIVEVWRREATRPLAIIKDEVFYKVRVTE